MKPYEKLKKVRMSQHKTTYELSKLTGIPQSTISKIENGKRKLDSESLTKITAALNIPIESIFTNQDKWKDEILKNNMFMGIDTKAFLEADPARREAFLNELSQIPIYQAKINTVTDLIDKSDDETLKKNYHSMLQDVIQELNKKNDIDRLISMLANTTENLKQVNPSLSKATFTKNNHTINLYEYFTQQLEINNSVYRMILAHLQLSELISKTPGPWEVNLENSTKELTNVIRHVIEHNKTITKEILNGNQEE